jgi:hypothetical protein
MTNGGELGITGQSPGSSGKDRKRTTFKGADCTFAKKPATAGTCEKDDRVTMG